MEQEAEFLWAPDRGFPEALRIRSWISNKDPDNVDHEDVGIMGLSSGDLDFGFKPQSFDKLRKVSFPSPEK